MAVLNTLVEGKDVWMSPVTLATTLGLTSEQTEDLLCELDLGGWLELWETEDGPLVTLSPLAAERLGVRLVEVGVNATPRWACLGDPDPPAPRVKNVCRDARGATLEFVVDTSIPAEVAAIRGERAERVARANPVTPETQSTLGFEDLPKPSMLIGIGLTPWPGPGSAHLPDCPACGGRALAPRMYCLFCDRWGLDRLAFANCQPIVPEGAVPAPSKPKPLKKVRWDQAEVDRQKQRRKARRKKRQKERKEAEAFLRAKTH